VKASLENVRKLNGREKGKEREKVETQQGIKEPEDSIEYLEDDEAVRRVMHMEGTGKGVGEWGYVNWRSGWADAAGTIIETRRKIQEIADTRGGVEWVSGSAARLLFSPSRIEGILLNSGQSLHANLTILAAGAWSSYLLPRSLKSLVSATGQVLAYLQLTPEESKRLENIPVLLNESTGMFLIPPTSDGVLKIARHGFGYRNPVCLADPEPILNEDEDIEVSLPSEDFTTLPEEAHYAFRTFLAQTLPWLASRPFIATRICWYTDTPTGDFLIDFHPWYGKSLLLATGGSGHGFKFLPVLGEKIVERIEGRLGAELSELWKWRIGDEDWNGMCEDGSRGGQRGMELRRELRDSIQGFEGEGQRYR
jgi:sarcosine oxidase/L-pipecolate oxidase